MSWRIALVVLLAGCSAKPSIPYVPPTLPERLAELRSDQQLNASLEGADWRKKHAEMWADHWAELRQRKIYDPDAITAERETPMTDGQKLEARDWLNAVHQLEKQAEAEGWRDSYYFHQRLADYAKKLSELDEEPPVQDDGPQDGPYDNPY